MAVWQFDLSLVPRDQLQTGVRSDIEQIGRNEFDATDWWAGYDLPKGYQYELRSLLGHGPSWDEEWEIYGTEDGTRLDVLRCGSAIEEVRLRIDVRNLEVRLIDALLEFIRGCNCVLVAPGHHVVEPTLDAVWIEIELSPTLRFVRDPQSFIAEIRKRHDLA